VARTRLTCPSCTAQLFLSHSHGGPRTFHLVRSYGPSEDGRQKRETIARMVRLMPMRLDEIAARLGITVERVRSHIPMMRPKHHVFDAKTYRGSKEQWGHA